MNTTYYTITYKGKKYWYESPVYGKKKVAGRLNVSIKSISFGADTTLPCWPPHRKTLKELWKQIHPAFIFNGKIDTVVELRKDNWIARAWGFVIGQIFFGMVIFFRV